MFFVQINSSDSVCVILYSKPLKEYYTIDDLRDVFMRIRANLDSRRVGWAQYVLPTDNALPENLAAASSAADAAGTLDSTAPYDDKEKLEQLMIEARAVLARQVSY